MGLLEGVRLILRGGSVIDWHRLGFDTAPEVRRFLAVNGFLPDDPEDVAQVRSLLRHAKAYLAGELHMKIAEDLWNPKELETPFLIASDMNHRWQAKACIMLKVVHTINHMQARELRFGLSLSENEIFELVDDKVTRSMRGMELAGYPIVHFSGGRKTQESTITKLLSKRRATAAQILDRVRFRVIVEHADDLPVVLAEMTRRLVPYNYVVPEETTNDIIDFPQYVARLPQLAPHLGSLQYDLKLENSGPVRRDVNECSAEAFRMLNFVIDWPLRITEVMQRSENAHLQHLGRIVFLNVEFQMFDRATWSANELNSTASHDAYKERQRKRVRARLLGAVDPSDL